jgi:hypothetical protein
VTKILGGVSALWCLLLTLACVSSGQVVGNSPYMANHDWVGVAPPSTGFSCQMPQPPEMSTNREQAPDGSSVSITHGHIVMELPWPFFLGFTVTHNDYGLIGGATDVLNEVEDSVVEAGEGRAIVRSRQDSEWRGFPMRDVVIDRDQAVLRGRFIVGRSRVYAMYAIMPNSAETELSGDVDRFFNSASPESADAPSVHGNGALALGQWGWIAPGRSLFAVEMPGAPRSASATVDVGRARADTLIYEVADASTGTRFGVYESLFEERPDGEAIGALIGKLESAGYAVRSNEAVAQQGFAGREVRMQSRDSTVHTRFFVTARRLYEVRVTTPNAGEGSLDEAAERFFRSFRIL